MAKAKLITSPLPAAVAELYDVRDGLPAIFVSGEFGTVELQYVTLELAERLASAGYLIKRSSS